MKSKKLLACLLAGSMVLTMAACGTTDETADAPATETPAVETEAPAEAAVATPSTDFADGNFAFVGNDKVVNPAAKDAEISLGDVDGANAVKIVSNGEKAFVAIQMDAMLGDAIADVAAVEVTLTSKNPGGTFGAVAGKLYALLGEKNDSYNTSWSIYLESATTKTVHYDLPAAAVEGNYIVVTLEDNVAGDAELYINSIAFLNAAGETLSVDTTAEFKAADTGEDRSNLYGISGAITMDLVGSGDGWSQIGYVDFTDEEWAALTTPGSVVEISYTSETGNMWMGLSGNAWTRIGVGDCDGSGQEYAYYNASKNIAQITYEQIANVVGDDTSAWDKQIFIESDGKFEVFSIKIGQQAPNVVMSNGIDIGLSGAGDGWGQIGYVDIPEDAYEVLKTPGSLVKIEYSSATGDLWMGLSGNAWTRIGVGDADGSGTVDALTDGSVCYVTYDMIVSLCGEDTSAWDKQIFIESNDKFEVYSVTIGMAAEFTPNNKQVDCAMSTTAAGGWSQYGDGLSEEAVAALITPGSVINITYASETGECWIVMPDSAAGWMRVGVGDYDGSGQEYAVFDGHTCQITYEQIAAVCGDDPSTWGTRIQVESSSTFDVYSVTIGQTK